MTAIFILIGVVVMILLNLNTLQRDNNRFFEYGHSNAYGLPPGYRDFREYENFRRTNHHVTAVISTLLFALLLFLGYAFFMGNPMELGKQDNRRIEYLKEAPYQEVSKEETINL